MKGLQAFMNKYTFSTKTGKAYYCNSIPGFIRDDSTTIIGQLVKHSFEVNKEQSEALNKQYPPFSDFIHVIFGGKDDSLSG